LAPRLGVEDPINNMQAYEVNVPSFNSHSIVLAFIPLLVRHEV
jgi:hypothetical protein